MNISFISNLSSYLTASAPEALAKLPPTEGQKTLVQAVKAVNAAQLFGPDNEITFIIDRKLNIAVVRIVNTKTGDLVEQIPNEQVLKMAEEINRR